MARYFALGHTCTCFEKQTVFSKKKNSRKTVSFKEQADNAQEQIKLLIDLLKLIIHETFSLACDWSKHVT